MASIYEQREISPKLFTYGLFIAGLCALAYTLIFQKLWIAFIIMSIPLVAIGFIYSMRYSRVGYALYAMVSYYLTAIMRYSHQTGFSVALDILLVYLFICILFNIWRKQSDIKLSNAFNILTISYILWILFILIIFTQTPTRDENMVMGIRQWILEVPIIYIVSCIMADNRKMLKNSLIIYGAFTITAFLKLLYQRYRWFDAAEMEWLINEGGATTHLISSGIRYFSIFSDAGNFGANMGMTSIIYGITFINTDNRKLRVFYLAICIMAIIGMFMSGTRSAIIIPFSGLALYCLLSKNIKTIVTILLAGAIIYLFFAFTNIGDQNPFIKRMRTAFRPTEDASFNVRIENQKTIRQYLLTHPWGAGIKEGIPRTMDIDGQFVSDTIPPDSYYVSIWTQTGYIGLILYLTIYAAVLIRCCYIVMFKVRDRELRHTLAALLCGVFGIWLNGYAGEGMGMPPNNFLIAAALAFVLNGAYIDRQMSPELIENKNNKI